MSDELKPCPSCGFDDEAFAELKKKLRSDVGEKSRYWPEITQDPVFNSWVITCRNCSMTVLFREPRGLSIEMWNSLPRRAKDKLEGVE